MDLSRGNEKATGVFVSGSETKQLQTVGLDSKGNH